MADILGSAPGNASFGTGSPGTLEKRIQRSYSSSVELVDGEGNLIDIIYSGSLTRETIVTQSGGGGGAGGGGAPGGNSATTRQTDIFSNEDVQKQEIETTTLGSE